MVETFRVGRGERELLLIHEWLDGNDASTLELVRIRINEPIVTLMRASCSFAGNFQ